MEEIQTGMCSYYVYNKQYKGKGNELQTTKCKRYPDCFKGHLWF